MDEVTLLLNVRGETISVYARRAAAEEKAAKFNADPFIAPGEADPDAPYSVTTWMVTP